MQQITALGFVRCLTADVKYLTIRQLTTHTHGLAGCLRVTPVGDIIVEQTVENHEQWLHNFIAYIRNGSALSSPDKGLVAGSVKLSCRLHTISTRS